MKLVGAIVGATMLIACTQAADAGRPTDRALPSVASMAGAFDQNGRAPGPTAPIVNATCSGDVEYCPSVDQLRVDRSFSAIAMDSLLSRSTGALSRINDGACEPAGECEWRDAGGVRHFAWGGSEADLRIVIKSIDAAEVPGKSIGALGIGMARRQEEVLANVRRFLPGVVIDCDPARVSGNVGPVECGATLNPGWFQIGFDRNGNLLRIRFDAYQFT